MSEEEPDPRFGGGSSCVRGKCVLLEMRFPESGLRHLCVLIMGQGPSWLLGSLGSSCALSELAGLETTTGRIPTISSNKVSSVATVSEHAGTLVAPAT